MSAETISLSTVGALIDYDYRLTVYCATFECWNHARVDLQSLADRIGRDHPCLAPDLKRYFTCSKCSSKEVTFILSAGSSAKIVPTPIETRSTYDHDYSGKRRRTRRSRK